MLTALQRDELCHVVAEVCPSLTALEQMLKFDVSQMLATISPPGPLDDVVREVVASAERGFWTPQLIAACVKRSRTASLRDFLARYPELDPGGAGPSVDHYATTFFANGRVFLCRTQLRQSVRVMGQPRKSRVLVVHGPRGSGKSYTKDFIEYVLAHHPAHAVNGLKAVYLDLDAHEINVETLARRLAMALGIDPETIPHRPVSDREQDSRWLPDLFLWLSVGVSTATYPARWLVLDGFRTSLPTACLDLIQMLADAADGDLPQLRLVLINYPNVDALPYSQVEAIPAPPIGRADMEQFIGAILAKLGMPAAPAVVTAAVDQIEQQVAQQVEQQVTKGEVTPEDQPRLRLKKLNVALTKTVERFIDSAEPASLAAPGGGP